MSITPVEIGHVRFPRRPFGYGRHRVREVMDEIAASYGDAWAEREDLRERIEELEAELRRHKELEEMLRKTLVSAERSVDAMREQARRDADTTLRDAEQKARDIIGEAHRERERLRHEFFRLRETEKEFRARFHSVVTSTQHLVAEYEAELDETLAGDAA
jgi:cell division initiation protein